MSSVARLSALALLALGTAACQAPQDLEQVQQDLTGTFDWVESSGGIAGWHHTPESTGLTVSLEFTGDRVRAWRNGTLVGTARITVTEDTRRASPMPVYLVRYEPDLQVFPFASFEEHELHVTGKGSVVLADPCCDRYSHSFRKSGVRS